MFCFWFSRGLLFPPLENVLLFDFNKAMLLPLALLEKGPWFLWRQLTRLSFLFYSTPLLQPWIEQKMALFIYWYFSPSMFHFTRTDKSENITERRRRAAHFLTKDSCFLYSFVYSQKDEWDGQRKVKIKRETDITSCLAPGIRFPCRLLFLYFPVSPGFLTFRHLVIDLLRPLPYRPDSVSGGSLTKKEVVLAREGQMGHLFRPFFYFLFSFSNFYN